ncbi:FAD-binding monooxygenase (plasmid) [Rhodococcoides fascians A21d2]|uniref:FAD-dependent monooxygenase n=1 Tax=Rhodococcoides fascians TaxID=1828 RepID=UPI00055C2B44|nr:FAD-dependent monooxygenase [Rhodococcus fascians]QII03691.1 FAD-binding monooxygenase [Rhodococcus fascians A21d2]
MNSSTIDVLIVGAGPTGTALAIDLIRRGVSVRLIDRSPNEFDGSRAKGVQPRTMEVLEDLGVIDEILANGSTYPKMGIHLGPVTIPKRMIASAADGSRVPYPDTWLIPQNRTVAALHRRFEAVGGLIELGTELSSFESLPDHVVTTVAGPSGDETITSLFLVGADGGSSRVRKGIGVDFVGSTDEQDRMLIVDAAVDGVALSRNYWHVWPGLRGRFVGACPLPHSDLFQWMIRLSPNEAPPTDLVTITDRIRSHTGMKKLRLTAVQWRSVFRPNIRLAERYRSGRVFLAGDAAHVHTPAGAQGMNTGIGDAYNLGWKLAQVLAGADADLLDTYENERRPIAAAVLGLSTAKYDGIAKLDPSSLKRGADEQQLTLTYFGGPLASAQSRRTAGVSVGDRAPDAVLLTTDGAPTRLFESMKGPHFTAIALGPMAAFALAVLQWPSVGAELRRLVITPDAVDVAAHMTVILDPKNELRKSYGITGDAIVLVRPDGYIGNIALNNHKQSTAAAVRTLTGTA